MAIEVARFDVAIVFVLGFLVARSSVVMFKILMSILSFLPRALSSFTGTLVTPSTRTRRKSI